MTNARKIVDKRIIRSYLFLMFLKVPTQFRILKMEGKRSRVGYGIFRNKISAINPKRIHALISA